MEQRAKDYSRSRRFIQKLPLHSVRLRLPYFVAGLCSGLLIMVYQIPTCSVAPTPYTKCDIPNTTPCNCSKPTPYVKCETKPKVNLSRHISEIADHLDEAIMRNKPPSEQLMAKIHGLFQLLEPQYKKESAPNISDDVCMESYTGTKYGWVTENCTYAKPMSQLIEVLLYYPSCEEKLARILQGIRKTDGDLTVRMALKNGSCTHVISKFKVKTIISSNNTNPGVAWNRLISQVSTPYLLVGRNLDNFDAEFSSLIRQIRVLGTTPNVQVVGGAFRNQSGHWRVGCFQSDIRNYALTYQDGYFVSRNECMYCDHLLGPFVARTNIVKNIPFDDSLTEAVLFVDWFLQLRKKRMHVMNCPDVMYLAAASDTEEKISKSELWIPLARKWELNKLTWPTGRTHSFSCNDAGITCDNIYLITRNRLMPLCCVKEMTSNLRFIESFFANQSIQYEVFSGAVLASVKMADFCPWDIDFDIKYPLSKRDIIVESKKVFAIHGLTLGSIDAYNLRGFCRLFTRERSSVNSNFYFELLPYLNTPLLEYQTTKINFGGVWVNGPTNPGAYARFRYGHEILKHAQSYRHTGTGDEFSPYTAGHFIPCNTDHHSCLDRYPTDGNLNFKVK